MIAILLIGILAVLKLTAVISISWMWIIIAPIAVNLFFYIFSKDCSECL